jgi:menaquinone-dependent protoporphyrinogen IX oxidase
MSGMRNLLLVYHSQSGACTRLAIAAAAGIAEESGISLRVRRAWEAGTEDIDWAAAVLLGAAENAGAAAGGMKDFLDRTLYPCHGAGLVRSYALFISAGNDGRGAARQITRQLSAIPWRPVAPALLLRGPPGPEHCDAVRELGQTLAAGLALGIF